MPVTRIVHDRVVPVIEIDEISRADRLADSLLEGGLGCAEVTLRTDAALFVIERLAARGDLAVGAGTVLSLAQGKAAVDAGARFVVSPGLNRELVSWCVQRSVPVLPGCATATEIMAAMAAGAAVVKFFPAEPLGGVPMLRALSGVFGSVRFLPTGGIGPDTMCSYLELPAVAACGGSWMVKPAWIRDGRFDRIREETARTVSLARGCTARAG